jgi:hypothetical protein
MFTERGSIPEKPLIFLYNSDEYTTQNKKEVEVHILPDSQISFSF